MIESDSGAVCTRLHELALVLSWNVAHCLVLALFNSYLCVLISLSRLYSSTQRIIVEGLVCAGHVLALASTLYRYLEWSALNVVGTKKCYMARKVISPHEFNQSLTQNTLSMSYSAIDVYKL